MLGFAVGVAVAAGAVCVLAERRTVYLLILRMLGRAPWCPTLALLSLERIRDRIPVPGERRDTILCCEALACASVS